MSERNEFFEKFKQGLQECIDFENGDKTKGRETIRSIPEPQYFPSDITQLRKSLNMTQKGMATVLGVSTRTVEAWETGRSHPKGTATRMLYLIENDNSIVQRLLE